MSSSSSTSASATSKLTTVSIASASSKLTASSASASCMLTIASASASSKLTTATPTLKRTVSNTSLDSARSQDPGHPTVHKRIHLDELSDEASSSSDNDSGDSDLDDDDVQEEEEDAVWEMMAPNVWDALYGAHCEKTIEWKKEMNDIVEVFGHDSEIMTKLQGLATGASIELVDGKVLGISGPAQKVDHLVNVMQRLLVVFGPSTKNYIVITVGGAQVSHHLASLKQTVGAKGRVVAAEKIHFSVCKTDGTWSAVDVRHLAKDIAAILAQAPQSIHDAFICDDIAFFNPNGIQIQVLGVCPSDEASPIHALIAMLQDALQQQGGLIMETTTHATIINRRKGSASLATILAPYVSSSHNWMGPLSIQKVAVSRFVTSLHSKNLQYFNLWEVDV